MNKPAARKPQWNRIIYAGFSVLVTAGILGYLFTRVSMGEVIDLIRQADVRGVILFVALSMGQSIFRTWRYAVVLQTSGHRPGSVALFLVVIVRNFFSDLLPARLGTLIYVYITTTRLRVPFGPAASSFALAFLFDMIALAPMIALAALAAGGAAGFSPVALAIAGVVFLAITVAVLVALPWLADFGARCTAHLRFLGEKRCQRWAAAVENAAQEIRGARKAGIYGKLLFLSLGVRICKYGSLYVFLYALLAPRGYQWSDLPIPKVFIGLCSSELAASLPISGIAGFGVYEGAWAVTFRLLGFDPAMADLTAISHHLFTQVYGYSLGAFALLLLMLPMFNRRRTIEDHNEE